MPWRGGLFKPLLLNANDRAPRHAARLERPNGLQTTPPRGKAAAPKAPEPKSKPCHSSSNIRWSRRSQAPAWEEERAVARKRSPPCPAEVPPEPAEPLGWEWARGQDRCLPPGVAAYKQVAGS